MKPAGDESFLPVTVTHLSSGRSCFALPLLVPGEKEAFLQCLFSLGAGGGGCGGGGWGKRHLLYLKKLPMEFAAPRKRNRKDASLEIFIVHICRT